MKKPNIRVLHTEWSGGWGGQEIRIINEMQGVRARGIDVHLACADHTPIYKKAKALGFPVHHLPFRGTVDFKTLRGLMRLSRQLDIDIINTHSGKDTWVGGFAAKLTGKKFIRTRHLSYPVNPSRLNFINEWADCVITAGEETRLAMIRTNRIKPERIVAIPTGPDAQIFDPEKYDALAVRKRLGLSPEHIVIGAVAFMRAMKRYDVFVEVVAKLIAQNKNVRCVIVGDGPMREKIEAQIADLQLEDYFILTGMIEQPADIMSTFDIAMLTSDRGEVTPQSLLQYLLMNIPTICTRVGSVADYYQNDHFILVEPNDVDAMTNALTPLVNDAEKREAMRTYCAQLRPAFAAQFSLDAMIDKTLQLYEKLITH